MAGTSPAHGVKDVDDFLLDLIRDPDLPGKVNDIAVECGNSLYQSILDRYIDGSTGPSPTASGRTRPTCRPSAR